MTTFHTELPQWTEGVCGDGAAILRDGVMIPIEEVIARLNQAEAALVAPEQGPTDQQIMELMPQQLREDLAAVSRLAAHGAGPDVGPGLFRVTLNTGIVEHCRAVLARWGRPAVEPVPVSERLPGPEDCDVEGLCWCSGSCSGYEQDFVTAPDERLLWVLSRITEENDYRDSGKLSCTHWLPHWALPVPGVEGKS
ncbi:MAG: hypothetical protein EBR82_61580 [Caulobacteraceae bacterium]|nr:hypothetical protein [Caulobacteraceae bacterium]